MASRLRVKDRRPWEGRDGGTEVKGTEGDSGQGPPENLNQNLMDIESRKRVSLQIEEALLTQWYVSDLDTPTKQGSRP